MKSTKSVLGAAVAIIGLFAATAMATAAEPEAIVQAQLDAYNARDLEAFLATYDDGAELFEHPSKLLATGIAQLRQRYAMRFAEPNLHAEIIKRTVMGNIVVDHEKVTRNFPSGKGASEAIAIYEVRGSRISRVWFIFGPAVLDPKP